MADGLTRGMRRAFTRPSSVVPLRPVEVGEQQFFEFGPVCRRVVRRRPARPLRFAAARAEHELIEPFNIIEDSHNRRLLSGVRAGRRSFPARVFPDPCKPGAGL